MLQQWTIENKSGIDLNMLNVLLSRAKQQLEPEQFQAATIKIVGSMGGKLKKFTLIFPDIEGD